MLYAAAAAADKLEAPLCTYAGCSGSCFGSISVRKCENEPTKRCINEWSKFALSTVKCFGTLHSCWVQHCRCQNLSNFFSSLAFCLSAVSPPKVDKQDSEAMCNERKICLFTACLQSDHCHVTWKPLFALSWRWCSCSPGCFFVFELGITFQSRHRLLLFPSSVRSAPRPLLLVWMVPKANNGCNRQICITLTWFSVHHLYWHPTCSCRWKLRGPFWRAWLRSVFLALVLIGTFRAGFGLCWF